MEKIINESMVDDALDQAVRAKGVADYYLNHDNVKEVNDSLRSASKNISTLGDKAKDIEDRFKQHTISNKSIVARAKNSVLQFPIYVTKSIRANEAQIISKLFERVYATLVQTVISQTKYINEDEANNLVFLRRFHTNIQEASDVLVNKYYNSYFEATDELDQMMKDSVFYSQQLTENITVSFKYVTDRNNDLFSENNRLLNDPLTGFVYLMEADKISIPSPEQEKRVIDNRDFVQMAKNRMNLSAEDERLIGMSWDDIRKIADSSNDPEAEYSSMIDKKTKLSKELNNTIDSIKSDIKNGRIKGYSFNGVEYLRVVKKDKTLYQSAPTISTPQLLRESEIKKINGMLPYTMEVSFRIKDSAGNVDKDVRYIIGIKTVLHGIYINDLVDELPSIINGNNRKLSKVKYKTGEISFMDYLFNIKGLKADASKNITGSKKWINTLKRLSEFNKLNGTLFKKPIESLINGNVPIPNGTIILTSSDVANLINTTGIDLNKISNARKLAKSLFLISVVIVDATSGTMKVFFPDSDKDWDIQSLAAVDAEVSKTDNSTLMRELNKMVGSR